MTNMNINCLPDYAKDYKFIVYRVVYGQKWFYGAYNNPTTAYRIAAEVGGEVA